MRDSLGGTMLFWIVLILFSIFTIFIAFIIRYARVYKIKNSIVDYIDKNEGIKSQEELEFALLNKGYSPKGEYKICRYIIGEKGGYYTLTLYSRIEFPIAGDLLAFNIGIYGESRTIETGTKIRNYGNEATGLFTSYQNECKRCSLVDSNCENVDA